MNRGARGFTLIELLLAIAVTAILSATVYASLRIAATTRDKATEAVGKNRSVMLALDLVRRDLQAVPPPVGELAGGFLGEDDHELDTITFTTANAFLPPGDRLSDLINVSIALENDPDDDQNFRLVRNIITNLLSPTAVDPQTQVLARGLSGFDVAYSDGSDWLDDWDSTQHDNTLPLAVRLTLYHVEAQSDSLIDQEKATSLIVMIPAGQRGDSIFSGVSR